MKKILYSLLALTFVLAGCEKFEEYTSEKYPAGPTVTVEATEVTDSTFNLKVTPAAGTYFYSYVVEKANQPTEHKAADLLKGTYKGIANQVIDATKVAALTNNMRKNGAPLLLPNTTYQIYAVASSDKGITGEVVNVTVTTTDGLVPKPKTFKATGNNVDVTLSENVTRGTGNVIAKFYKEFDIQNPVTVTVPADSIVIKGAVVTVKPQDVNPGAFVTISWEAGAFKDIFGNPVAAFTSGLNMSTGKFTGVNYRAAVKEFTIAESCFVAPEVGSFFVDWVAFKGEVELGQNIFVKSSAIKSGDLKVIYSTATKKAYMNLEKTDWSVSGSKLTFKLPAEPGFGDNVGFTMNKSVIFDVWGNPNAAYTKETPKWNRFLFTKSLVLGDFRLDGISTYDGEEYEFGEGTITEDTEYTNGLILKDFIVPGFKMVGEYDLDAGKMYLLSWDSLGNATLGGVEYEFYNYNYVNTSADLIEFTINPEGTITSSQYAILVYNPLTGKASYYDKLDPAVFSRPAATPAASKRKASSTPRYSLRPITNPELEAKILKKIKGR